MRIVPKFWRVSFNLEQTNQLKKIAILPIWHCPGLRTSSGRRCLPVWAGVICGVRTYDTWEVQGCFFALRCSCCFFAVEGLKRLLVKNQCCGRGRLSESSLLELDSQFLWVSGAGKHSVLRFSVASSWGSWHEIHEVRSAVPFLTLGVVFSMHCPVLWFALSLPSRGVSSFWAIQTLFQWSFCFWLTAKNQPLNWTLQ